jgi:hypothetical protein
MPLICKPDPCAGYLTHRFSTYRDAMEAVHNFEGVLLACLVIAFEEVTARSNLFERIEVRRWVCCCVRVLA